MCKITASNIMVLMKEGESLICLKTGWPLYWES